MTPEPTETEAFSPLPAGIVIQEEEVSSLASGEQTDDFDVPIDEGTDNDEDDDADDDDDGIPVDHGSLPVDSDDGASSDIRDHFRTSSPNTAEPMDWDQYMRSSDSHLPKPDRSRLVAYADVPPFWTTGMASPQQVEI